jgi:Septum formation
VDARISPGLDAASCVPSRRKCAAARRRGGWLGTAIVALALLSAGCAAKSGVEVAAPTSAPSSTGPEAGAPSTPQPTPKVGDCHGPVDADLINAPTDTRPTVSCTRTHGMETFYVGEIDASITTWPGNESNAELGQQVDEACAASHLAYLGVTPQTATDLPPDRLQVYAYYIPSKADFDAGARWFRCDALVAPVDSQPTTIDGTLKDVYAKPLPAAYRLCGASLGRTAACNAKHEIEYLASVALSDLTAYPAQRDDLHVTAACRMPLLTALGLTEERPDLAFGYLLPSQEEWDAGVHGATCVVGTKDSATLDDTLAGIGPSKPLPIAS